MGPKGSRGLKEDVSAWKIQQDDEDSLGGPDRHPEIGTVFVSGDALPHRGLLGCLAASRGASVTLTDRVLGWFVGTRVPRDLV